MKNIYGRGGFKDLTAKCNCLNSRRMRVFWSVRLLVTFIFLAMAFPATAGKYPHAKLIFEISYAAVDIQKKHGMIVESNRDNPWFAIDGRPGHYSIIFYQADKIPQGVVLDTVKLCMDLYKKQGLKERLERIRIVMYRESKEEWRNSLFLGIGKLTTVKPIFKLTIGRE